MRIEVARGFVGQQHGGGIDQGPGDGHALLLAAGKLAGLMVAAPGETHHFQQLRGAAFDLRTGVLADQPRDADVLEGRELGQQVVELEHETDASVAESGQRLIAQRKNILPVDFDPSAVGPRKRTHDLQQRGLAGAAGTDDRNDLAPGDVERNAFQHFEVAEALVYIGNFNHRSVFYPVCISLRSPVSTDRRPPTILRYIPPENNRALSA